MCARPSLSLDSPRGRVKWGCCLPTSKAEVLLSVYITAVCGRCLRGPRLANARPSQGRGEEERAYQLFCYLDEKSSLLTINVTNV